MSIKSLAVFCGSKSGVNPLYMEHAKQLGYILAEKNITLVYGGSSKGIMGALANAALEKNGKVINSGRGGVWEYRGTSPDPRSQPIQAHKMAECVAAQGRYVQKMQGISISGIDFPKH